MSQLPRTPTPQKPKKRVWKVYWYDFRQKDDKTFTVRTPPKFENGFCSFTANGKNIVLGGHIAVVDTEE